MSQKLIGKKIKAREENPISFLFLHGEEDGKKKLFFIVFDILVANARSNLGLFCAF